VRQLLPGAPEGAASYAATALGLAQPGSSMQQEQGGFSMGALEVAVR
jgi:hypothetical protein